MLNLVYNPLGPSLPPAQDRLEADYKRELGEHFGIVFNHLFTLANMPISRFGSTLITQGKFASYMALLHSAHNPDNLDGVMCRTLVSVDYRGYLYDCDFNQMLGIPMIVAGKASPPRHRSPVDGPRRRADRGRRSLLRLHRRAGVELRRRARLAAPGRAGVAKRRTWLSCASRSSFPRGTKRVALARRSRRCRRCVRPDMT